MYTPNGGAATIPNGRASNASEFRPQRIRVTKVKIVNFLLELCQWSSLAIPIFVTSEGVARTVDRIQAGNTTSNAEEAGSNDPLPYYWLLVAASIAYAATVTLLIYLPVKYCFMWKNRFLLENAKWLPAILMHLLLSVLPCMALMLVGIELQAANSEITPQFDTYTHFAVPLVVLGVLVTSWVEKVRRFPNLSSAGAEMTEGPTSPRSMVNPVYTIDGADGSQSTDEQSPRDPPGPSSTPHTPVSIRRSFPMSFSSSRSSPRPRPKLTSNDDRARILSAEFFSVYDVLELLLVTNFHDVCRTYWIFPIYVVAFLSMFKSILRLDHRFLPLVSMATHEIPFLILRIALLAKFGIEIMSVVYPLKNLAVISFYVYYNFIVVIIKSRAFNRNRYSFPNRDDAVSTTSFSTISSRPGSTLY
ncbi:transmembrane protein 236-like [Branchiostoma floridae x Branchiostoma belcheri]